MKTKNEFIGYAAENGCSAAAHGLLEQFEGWDNFAEKAREIAKYGCGNTTDLIGKKAIDFYLRYFTEIEEFLEARDYYETLERAEPATNLMEKGVWAFVEMLCTEAMGIE